MFERRALSRACVSIELSSSCMDPFPPSPTSPSLLVVQHLTIPFRLFQRSKSSFCTTALIMADTEKPNSNSMPSFTSTTNAPPHNAIANSPPPLEFYPRAKSSYYFGPPASSSAFGEPPTGKIGLHLPKEIVRIERDYSSGELPQFHSSFPLELEGRISPTTFSEIINDINTLLISAHNVRRVWVDNTIAILTFYLTSLVFGTHYGKEMKKLDELIEKFNKNQLNQVGLNMVNPRKSAFLFIEVEYF